MSRRNRRDIGPAVYRRLEGRLAAHRDRFPTMKAFARHVGMDQSVFTRWRNGATPSLATYLTVFDELEQLDRD